MASAQLVLPGDDALALVASPGLSGNFSNHFAIVDGVHTAYGRALAASKVVEVPDVASDASFSADDKALLRDEGVRAVISVPIDGRAGTPVGVLSAHYRTLGPHDSRFAQDIAARVAERMRQISRSDLDSDRSLLREIAQLREALANRDLIAQAKGILMARDHVDEHQAFERLVHDSQHQNRKLRAIAAEIVETHSHDLSARGPRS
jgi:hypothetical protein